MAKWYIKFEQTHVQCPNRLVASIRETFNKFDGYLLSNDESKDAHILSVKNEVAELNLLHSRCKPVETWERKADDRVLSHSLNSYHVGSLIFLPVKKEVTNG
ncbi:MAG: hypothetical protein HWE07_13355 [Cytophagia bacterium]|nr:hypothetical protein [Cytophagia bacterium]